MLGHALGNCFPDDSREHGSHDTVNADYCPGIVCDETVNYLPEGYRNNVHPSIGSGRCWDNLDEYRRQHTDRVGHIGSAYSRDVSDTRERRDRYDRSAGDDNWHWAEGEKSMKQHLEQHPHQGGDGLYSERYRGVRGCYGTNDDGYEYSRRTSYSEPINQPHEETIIIDHQRSRNTRISSESSTHRMGMSMRDQERQQTNSAYMYSGVQHVPVTRSSDHNVRVTVDQSVYGSPYSVPHGYNGTPNYSRVSQNLQPPYQEVSII